MVAIQPARARWLAWVVAGLSLGIAHYAGAGRPVGIVMIVLAILQGIAGFLVQESPEIQQARQLTMMLYGFIGLCSAGFVAAFGYLWWTILFG
jgi:tryptophan-rich sensory protein